MIKMPRGKIAWRPAKLLVYYSAALLGFVSLLLWHLSTKPSAASPAELAAKNSSNLTALGSNILFAPWRLLTDLFLHINSHSLLSLRLPSVLFAVLVAVCFYYALSSWLGKPIGFLSTVLLATTPFFLLLARNGTPDVLFLSLVILVSAYTFFSRNAKRIPRTSALALIAAAAFCLYVPGMIWFLILGIILKRGQLFNVSFENKLYPYLFGVLFLILIAPLILVLVLHPIQLKSLFLIPEHFKTPIHLLEDWLWMIVALFVRAKQHETLMIGRLPILDVAQTGLVLFGFYVIWSRLRAHFFTVVGLILFITFAAALDSRYNFLAGALALLSVAVAFGLRFLYIEWIHIFPRNPIPRTFAITLMALVVLVHVAYGIRYSLIAWPASVAVQHLYVLKLK
jgi:hypothetical protein